MPKELSAKQQESRTCNLGTMTPAMKVAMIKNALRKLTMYWKPIQQAKRNARGDKICIQVPEGYQNFTKTMPTRISYDVMVDTYLCNLCKRYVPEKFPNVKDGKLKFKNNVAIDHINPVITEAGFTGWTDFVDRAFNEDVNQYQCLCLDCHKTLSISQNLNRNKPC